MTSVVLNEQLSQLSLLAVYVAMALYTLAFLGHVLELARRASSIDKNRAAAAGVARFALVLLLLAVAAHSVGVVLRGIAAGRVPWANMYEFSLTGSLIVVLIFLVAQRFAEVRLLSALISGVTLLVLGLATTVWYVQIKSLMPALQSYWLVIHVIVAVLATAFFNIGALLAGVYLVRESKFLGGSGVGAGAVVGAGAGVGAGAEVGGRRVFARLKAGANRVMGLFPAGERLERRAYQFNIIGFILWSFTLIAGAIWAERAWHRYWGWDTKEVWTFIIWVIYAGYLHANATRGWAGKRSAWLALVGYAAVVFNFTIVNLFFKGLHVYSGLK